MPAPGLFTLDSEPAPHQSQVTDAYFARIPPTVNGSIGSGAHLSQQTSQLLNFKLEPAGTDWWVPSRTYFRIRMKCCQRRAEHATEERLRTGTAPSYKYGSMKKTIPDRLQSIGEYRSGKTDIPYADAASLKGTAGITATQATALELEYPGKDVTAKMNLGDVYSTLTSKSNSGFWKDDDATGKFTSMLATVARGITDPKAAYAAGAGGTAIGFDPDEQKLMHQQLQSDMENYIGRVRPARGFAASLFDLASVKIGDTVTFPLCDCLFACSLFYCRSFRL